MKRRPRDTSLRALDIVRHATEEEPPPERPADARFYEDAGANVGKNPAAVELGRRGGLKGGKARAEKLTPEQRREIAKKAAAARWRKDE